MDGTLECQIKYVDESDYTKIFYDSDCNPDGTRMEYQSGFIVVVIKLHIFIFKEFPNMNLAFIMIQK